MNSQKQVFLLLTNKNELWLTDLYSEIKYAVSALGQVHILFHYSDNAIPFTNEDISYFLFDNNLLDSLGYKPIEKKFIPGSNHFPLLDFYLKNPDFDFYWYIEDDVRYTGDWKNLFDFFTGLLVQPDFISSKIRTFQEEHKWYWFSSLSHPFIYIPHHLKLRSFNPIFRISRKALDCIHNALTKRWSGHHEVLIPTLLYLEGLEVRDFGGVGRFVVPGCENRFYITGEADIHGLNLSGTMRYRPVIKDETIIPNMLYHPVKK